MIDQPVAEAWQTRVSDWLVRSGCRYMMAWGLECGSWDDSVDWSRLIADNFEDVPDDRRVMTTWHENEMLVETFWFAHHFAEHPSVSLTNLVIIDIFPEDRENEILTAYFTSPDRGEE